MIISMHSPRPIEISPDAAQDSDDAYSWYERKEPGLGMRFLSSVNATLRSIQRTSAGYPIVYENYRKAVLRGFPYVIFYKDDDERISIIAIFHTSRNPESWQDRLQQTQAKGQQSGLTQMNPAMSTSL